MSPRRWRVLRRMSPSRSLALRAGSAGALSGAGYLFAGMPGAFLAAGLALTGRRFPRLAPFAALALLATAAAAAVLEQPLSSDPGAVARFPLTHDLAATTGRLAGIALIVAVFTLGRHDRLAIPARDVNQPSNVGAARRWRRSARRWPAMAAPLSLAVVVAATVLRFVGDGHLAWTTPRLLAVAVVVLGVAIVARRSRGTSPC